MMSNYTEMNNNMMPQQPEGEEKFEAYYRELEKLPPLKEKKKRSFMPFMSAFLAGAIVIGGLSFAADRLNLFTGGGTSQIGSNSSGSSYVGAGLTTVSQSTAALSPSDVYTSASPAVVKIENYTEPQMSSMFDDPGMWQFFGMSPQAGGGQGRGGQYYEQGNGYDSYGDGGADSGAEAEQSQSDDANLQLSGTGTGFIIDKSGYIVTNEHVVSGAKKIKVSVEGLDEPLTATVVSSSAELDIALLKVEVPSGAELTALSFADSDQLVIGDWVMAIGNPYGYDYTLTLGVVSAKERPITIQNESGQEQVYEHMLQTDASINPGNSGGPLLNEAGQVIGMNTAVSAEAQGIGFAIPSNIIVQYLNSVTSALGSISNT